jgi:hypothetical protein
MIEHDIRDIDRDSYLFKNSGVTTACFRCGLYNPSLYDDDGYNCEVQLKNTFMTIFQKGGVKDPFARYRGMEPIEKVSCEERPGLVTETIDWEAHKAFGRSL